MLYLILSEKMQFKTKRALLRNFIEADLEELALMLSDAELVKHTGFKKPISKEKAKEALDKWIEHSKENSLTRWAALSIETNRLIGWFMLMKTEFDGPELGFMIVKSQWGKGYATEVGLGVLEYARSLNIEKIYAVVNKDNLASIKVLEKVGMKRVKAHSDRADLYLIDSL